LSSGWVRMSGNLTLDAQAEGTRAGLWHEFGCRILCKVPALKCLPDVRPTWCLTEVWPDRSPHAALSQTRTRTPPQRQARVAGRARIMGAAAQTRRARSERHSGAIPCCRRAASLPQSRPLPPPRAFRSSHLHRVRTQVAALLLMASAHQAAALPFTESTCPESRLYTREP
jgi:hypothetical protein